MVYHCLEQSLNKKFCGIQGNTLHVVVFMPVFKCSVFCSFDHSLVETVADSFKWLRAKSIRPFQKD